MKMALSKAFFATVFLGGLPLLTHAAPDKPSARTVIKTVQANGKTVYSDKATDMSADAAKQFELHSYGAAPTQDEKKQVIDTSAQKVAETKPAATPPKDTQPAASQDSEQKKEVCVRLKQNLAALNAGRVVRFKEGGERYYLTDSEISTEKTKTVADISSTCSN
jgi:hypothetical protein